VRYIPAMTADALTLVQLGVALACLVLLQLGPLRRLAGGKRPSDRAAVALGVAWLLQAGRMLAGADAAGRTDDLAQASAILALVSTAVGIGLAIPGSRRGTAWCAALLSGTLALTDVYLVVNAPSSFEGQPDRTSFAVPAGANVLLFVWALWVALGHFPGERLRRRGFAWLYDRVQGRHAAFLAERKRALLGGLRGTVLEIGPGTAGNFEFFDRRIHWIGVEPNPHMRKRLARKAAAAGIATAFRGYLPDGGLELADASVDAVVSTLVQCSVPDPEAFVREVRRVLVPGGRFVFLEHVAAPRGTKLRRRQDLLTPLMAFCADGCHPNRELAAAIEGAGFSKVELEAFEVPREVVPRFVSPHVAGFAIR